MRDEEEEKLKYMVLIVKKYGPVMCTKMGEIVAGNLETSIARCNSFHEDHPTCTYIVVDKKFNIMHTAGDYSG